MGKCDRTPLCWSDGQNTKQNKNSYSKYIIILLFSDLPHNNRPFEWNCVSHAPGRYDTHYHLTKIPKVGFCMLPAMRSRSRHFLPALMQAMLPFTIMHYMMLQINHNYWFALRLTEGCMSCTLKSDVSILPAILMLTLMLIISSIKALCFLTTRTQQYHYIGNCLSPILWGSDNLFLSAMMFTLLLTFNCSFFKSLFFILISSLIVYPLSCVPLIYGNCEACMLGAS